MLNALQTKEAIQVRAKGATRIHNLYYITNIVEICNNLSAYGNYTVLGVGESGAYGSPNIVFILRLLYGFML